MLRKAMMSGAVAFAAIAVGVTVQAPVPAWATEIPFTITAPGLPNGGVSCAGPWFRESACGRIGPEGADKSVFYTAEDTLFSPYGRWGCDVHREGCGTKRIDIVRFCLQKDRPTQVDLVLDGGKLKVNADAECSSALATSMLGQNGEDDASPAQDVDTYTFEGKPGEKVEVALGRDGSGGSAGEVATLSVRATSGAPLGQRTGAVPLSLEVTLPGTVEVTVSRQPGNGAPLRGNYELEVIPQSGDIGERKLRPSSDVEQ